MIPLSFVESFKERIIKLQGINKKTKWKRNRRVSKKRK